jgi:acetoin utilization protein AcuB
MSHPVITIHPDLSLLDALDLMRTERIRRLPVVDKRGKLVGIVSERDLLHAGPSSASTFSVQEANYLLSKFEIKRIMTNNVITISEDTPIEEAARIMADHRIGGLPVVQDNGVVGIITETDLFKIFLELLGGRETGVRLAAIVPDAPGELARLTNSIFDIGGNIIALGTFLGESSENREVMIKVEGVDSQTLQETVEPLVECMVDIRAT